MDFAGFFLGVRPSVGGTAGFRSLCNYVPMTSVALPDGPQLDLCIAVISGAEEKLIGLQNDGDSTMANFAPTTILLLTCAMMRAARLTRSDSIDVSTGVGLLGQRPAIFGLAAT